MQKGYLCAPQKQNTFPKTITIKIADTILLTINHLQRFFVKSNYSVRNKFVIRLKF